MVNVLLTEQQLREGVQRLAGEIDAHFDGRPLTVVGVMTGSLVLLADLIRLLNMPLRVGVVQASSYRGETARSPLTVNSEMLLDIEGRDVLLIDDIFDTGHTLVEVSNLIRDYSPASIHSAVLLLKKGRQQVSVRPDFTAFEIPDEFVVGYGLDYQDMYRNLPYLGVLEDSDQ